jgi:hypothetical protein
VNTLGRPLAGVGDRACEVVLTGEVVRLRHGERAGSVDEVPRHGNRTVVGSDLPAIGVVTPHRRGDARVEPEASPQVESVRHVL